MQTAKYSCWTGPSLPTYIAQRSPSPTMSSPPGTPPAPSGIRRHRRTTACTTCRDRRKGGRSCKYLNSETPEFEFIQVKAPRKISKSPSPDSWMPVIERHFDTIKNLKAESPGRGGSQTPIWGSSSSEQISSARSPDIIHIQPQPAKNCLSKLGTEYLPSFQARLPAREVCDHFLESFRLSIHPLVSICHLETLEKNYEAFWADLSPVSSVESTLLIVAVLYTGASNSTINISQSSTLNRLYEELLSAIEPATYHVSNKAAALKLLQAYLLVNTFQLSVEPRKFEQSFLAPALKLAQSLNMHLDRPDQSSPEAQVYSRIWWHLVYLDVEVSIATGVQGLIRPNGCTTRLPSLINESTPHSRTQTPFSPIMVALQGQWQWAHSMQTWAHRLPNQDEVSHFISLIQNLLDLLPEGREENEWPRSYLKLLIDRSYCMLGLKFWLSDQFQGNGCNSDIIRAARSFLHNHHQLSTLTQTIHLKWFITSFAPPHHALFILFMHLSTCESLDNEAKISKPLIDQVLNLDTRGVTPITSNSTSTQISRSSSFQSASSLEPPLPSHRYDVLLRLYSRVWKKLGWNIELLQRSPSGSPRIGVLPHIGGLMHRDRSSSMESSPKSSWMELVTGAGAEAFEMDRDLDDLVWSGDRAWERWQNLAQDIFTRA
ncbi:fungal specific transcription factor domain-containing protein [Rutstroemia sp. NJR-2017a BBW]|nr:fungal specific transcription factor domain-containing protein [Rutstroemia sp. NJR-2017a BBW]